MTSPQWPCEAYGPEGLDFGALCFKTGNLDGARSCTDPAACHEAMEAERRRLYDRVQVLATEGDPIGEYLAATFTSPGQLLGGADEPPEPPEQKHS